METTVKLVAHTAHPLQTLRYLWEASRTDAALPWADPETLHELEKLEACCDPRVPRGLAAETRRLVSQIMASEIPVAENVSFTFMLDGVSVALREQMVRHRIGVKVGDRLGCDIVPDLADSTWWSQSMRVLRMDEFAQAGAYHVPASVAGNEALEAEYDDAMQKAECAYNALIDAGVPAEDARNVLPLATCHRISWTLNLAALRHIVGKRGCWILQLGIWKPVIVGMVEELATKIDPVFRELIAPPCVDVLTDKFIGCKFRLDNQKRVKTEDPLPPCALYLAQHRQEALAVSDEARWAGRAHWFATGPTDTDWGATGRESTVTAADQKYAEMRNEYQELWGRSVETGARLTVGGKEVSGG